MNDPTELLLDKIRTRSVYMLMFFHHVPMSEELKQAIGRSSILNCIKHALMNMSTKEQAELMDFLQRNPRGTIDQHDHDIISRFQSNVLCAVNKRNAQRRARIDILARRHGVRLPLDDQATTQQLSRTVTNTLLRSGFFDVIELTEATHRQVLSIRGIGTTSIARIEKLLGANNLSFAHR